MSLTAGSLFSGYGGLDQAVQMVLDTELLWYCEIEPAAIRVMEHHYPGVPNLGDISAVDWATVERVNILTGGFPCQDVSAAGRGAGLAPGTRSGLWARFDDAIAALRPDLVFIENVRGLLNAKAHSAMEFCPWCVGDGPESGLRALGAVLGDLADLGLNAEWCVRRASDDGAPHQRGRVFILATYPRRGAVQRRTEQRGVPGAQGEGTGEEVQRERRGDTPGDGGATAPDTAVPGGRRLGAGAVSDDRGRPVGVGAPEPRRRGVHAAADTEGLGRGEGRTEPGTGRGVGAVGDCGGAAADADRRGCGSAGLAGVGRPVGGWGTHPRDAAETADEGASARWGVYAAAIARWESILGRRAPAPTVLGARGGPALSPLFVEWMQGLALGHVTDAPEVTRSQALKLLGNGVVPIQAASALRLLLPRLLAVEAVAA